MSENKFVEDEKYIGSDDYWDYHRIDPDDVGAPLWLWLLFLAVLIAATVYVEVQR